MYKLLVADDEQIVLDGIKFMVEEMNKDIEIVGMVNSGRAAVEACAQGAPDIILMDIKMPGINGIEAIDTIKKRHPDIKFIIISAYEQFEYAKQAVELSVCDYILKPINQPKLRDVLRKAMDEIDEERSQRIREIENREKLEKVIPVLEHGFIYSLLMNAHYREEIEKYRELFEIQKDMGYILVLEFGEGDRHENLGNRIGTGVKGYQFYPKVQNIIKYKCKCIIGPLIINRITVLIFEDSYEKEYEQRIKAMELADNIYSNIAEVVDCGVYMGVGSCYKLDKIKNSLEEALYSLGKISSESILHINDICEIENKQSEYTYVDIKGDESYIIQLIETGSEEVLVQELNHFFRRVEKKFNHSIVDTRNIIMELMVMVLSCSYRNNLNEGEVGYESYLNELRLIDSLFELQNWCVLKVVYVSQIIRNRKGSHVSKIILQAKTFIDLNYNQDFSLNDVSKDISISPQYFSKIFKEEIGLSFVEYIRKKRMDVAKELLREKIYSVKEVCYKIGYNDPNYFSRLFKKLVGVSPTEFV